MITGPTTDIEIMSNAATLCGKAPFSTLDDGGEFADSIQALYNQIVPDLLSAPHWRFNVKAIQLNLIANFDPGFDNWQYAWQLPADFLSLIKLSPMQNFQIFENLIYTLGNSPIILQYRTQRPVGEWPAYFRRMVVYELAVELGFSVAQNAKLAAGLQQKLERDVRPMALYIDAQNHPSDPIQDRPWVAVRAGGYWGGC